MGVKLNEIANPKTIKLEQLSGKIIAIDAFNMLYQFLSTIRSADGTPLKTSKGKITSHLVGLFSRNANFLEKGLKPVYVFDGKSPEFKIKERERRKELKLEAMREYESAKEEQDIERMKKYASRTSLLDETMIKDSKRLLDALGIPHVQAPSEGEAQAAWMVRQGKAYASASEDYDSLLFGSPTLIRQLSVTGKKRKSKKIGTYTVEPQIIRIEEVLRHLGISQEQLIILGILVGTDYNIGGIKGIGPVKALKVVKENNNNFQKIFSELEYEKHFDTDWKKIYDFFKNPPVSGDANFEFGQAKENDLKALLVDEFEFSEERIEKFIEKMNSSKPKNQVSLQNFFK